MKWWMLALGTGAAAVAIAMLAGRGDIRRFRQMREM